MCDTAPLETKKSGYRRLEHIEGGEKRRGVQLAKICGLEEDKGAD